MLAKSPELFIDGKEKQPLSFRAYLLMKMSHG